MNKKLYKSATDKKIGGVLGGLAEYMNIDSTVLRLLYVVLSVVSAGFPGILVYIAAMIILPEKPEDPMNNFDN